MSIRIQRYHLLLPFVGLVVALFSLEVLFRVLPEKITQIDFSIRNLKWYFTVTRNAHKPFKSYAFNSLGGNNTVWHFNNLGFRDRPVTIERIMQRAEPIYRIVFIGDSVTMGTGVEEWEAFPSQVEKLLQFKKTVSDTTYFESINLSISGYSTVQYEEVMREIAVKLHPNMVIIGFLPFNDPMESAHAQVNQKYNYLRSLPDTILSPGVNNFLINHSYLHLAILSRYYTYITKYRIVFEDFLNSASYTELKDKGWLVSTELIGKMKDLADKNNIKLIIAGLPWSEDIIFKRTSEDMFRLKNITDKFNISYVDLTPAMLSYPRHSELFLNGSDIHLTAVGNLTVASAIAKFLQNQKLVPVLNNNITHD